MSIVAPVRSSIRHHLPAIVLLTIVLFGLFIRSFDPSLTLSIGDDNLTTMRNHYRMLPTFFTGTWSALGGLGTAGSPANPAPGFFLSWLVPFYKYVDANAIFHLFLMGVGGYFFIHDITRNRFAATAGGLFLMLQPHVLSHLQPGHVGHFIMVGWVPAIFLFIRRALVQGGFINWVLAGICLGFMLAAGQHDVAVFWIFCLAAYGLFLVIISARNHTLSANWVKVVCGVLVVAVLAVLLSAESIFANLFKQLDADKKATALESSQTEKMSSQDKWFWATQWSIPPVETIDSAVPGFFGWGSSSPDNPYRGRIGQTEGWMQHHQGMPNLNDVCQYLGAVTLLGLLVALVLRRRDPEMWFFAIAGLISIVLAFGKFGPLYRLFFAIPGMEALRNPIKWFYITSLCSGIVGALGLAEASRKERPPLPAMPAALLAFLPALAVAGIAGVLLGHLETSGFIFWQQERLVSLSARAIGVGFLFWSISGLAFFLLLTRHTPNTRLLTAGMALTLLVMAAELVYVNSHYMPYHPWQREVNAGPFTDFIRSVKMPVRMRFLRQDGVFHFLRENAVFEGMELIDPYPSRLPDAFMLMQRGLEPKDPVKFWRLSNARFIVAPGLLKDPAFKPVLSLKAGQDTVIVYELTNALPRCVWISRWEQISDKSVTSRLADPSFDPSREALLLASDPVPPLPPVDADPEASCRIISYTWNRILAETRSNKPGLVVSITRFDPDWSATVDNRFEPIWKVNAIMQGVFVPSGSHTVEFRYQPAAARPALTGVLVGWGIAALLLAGCLVAPSIQKRKTPP